MRRIYGLRFVSPSITIGLRRLDRVERQIQRRAVRKAIVRGVAVVCGVLAVQVTLLTLAMHIYHSLAR